MGRREKGQDEGTTNRKAEDNSQPLKSITKMDIVKKGKNKGKEIKID